MNDHSFSFQVWCRISFSALSVAGLVCLLIISGCTTSGSSAPEREVRGDTTIVRSGETGVWKQPVRLVEELAIGTMDGAEELMFGFIQEMAVDDAGGIYVFDGQVPALRYFDAEGNYVRTLGGKGQGPGEYQDAILGLDLFSDGRIVMRDPRNRRLNIYNPDGSSSDHWEVTSGLFTSQAMFLDDRDHVYLKILLARPEPNKPWRFGLQHYDNTGTVRDTIPEPSIAGTSEIVNGRYMPKKIWTWSSKGYMIVGMNDTYSFQIRYPNGKVLRVEREFEPIRFNDEERREWEAVNDWYRKYQAGNLTSEIPPTPSTKPVYKSIAVDEEARIWVERFVTAVKIDGLEPSEVDERTPPQRTWREPVVYDVFTEDGTYLGEVHAPEKTNIYVRRGEKAWGVRTGESGEPYVVRLVMDID